MQSPSDEWLHLFTSNVRDLYTQDALSLLAAPTGLIYRFRYEDRYVADNLREDWRAGAIAGKRVAVYFSVQHPLNFHAAAFVPLRMGTVTRSAAVGGVFTIEFAVSGYIPLAQVDLNNLARPVREFTEALKEELGTAYPDFYDPDNSGAPKRRSATLAGSPLVLVDSERNARQGARRRALLEARRGAVHLSRLHRVNSLAPRPTSTLLDSTPASFHNGRRSGPPCGTGGQSFASRSGFPDAAVTLPIPSTNRTQLQGAPSQHGRM